jgi:hypothetical protein
MAIRAHEPLAEMDLVREIERLLWIRARSKERLDCSARGRVRRREHR